MEAINNRLIIQFGTSTATTSTITCKFPITFTTKYTCVANGRSKNDVDGVGGAESLDMANSTISSVKFSHYHMSSDQGLNYIAIGF